MQGTLTCIFKKTKVVVPDATDILMLFQKRTTLLCFQSKIKPFLRQGLFFFDVRKTILVRRDGINEILHYRGQLIIDFVLHYVYRRRVQLINSIYFL